jgi:hypothetical protein
VDRPLVGSPRTTTATTVGTTTTTGTTTGTTPVGTNATGMTLLNDYDHDEADRPRLPLIAVSCTRRGPLQGPRLFAFRDSLTRVNVPGRPTGARVGESRRRPARRRPPWPRSRPELRCSKCFGESVFEQYV